MSTRLRGTASTVTRKTKAFEDTAAFLKPLDLDVGEELAGHWISAINPGLSISEHAASLGKKNKSNLLLAMRLRDLMRAYIYDDDDDEIDLDYLDGAVGNMFLEAFGGRWGFVLSLARVTKSRGRFAGRSC